MNLTCDPRSEWRSELFKVHEYHRESRFNQGRRWYRRVSLYLLSLIVDHKAHTLFMSLLVKGAWTMLLPRWVPLQIGGCYPQKKKIVYTLNIKEVSFLFVSDYSLWYISGFILMTLRWGVLDHLWVSPLQLILVSWSYVKVLQYLCEYMKSAPTFMLFFIFSILLKCRKCKAMWSSIKRELSNPYRLNIDYWFLFYRCKSRAIKNWFLMKIV